MDYWPKGWECRRVVEKCDGCEFYDPNGVNNQCGHPDRSCIYLDEEQLYHVNGVDTKNLSNLLLSPDEVWTIMND